MKLTVAFLLLGLVCAVYAQADAAKDAAKDAGDKAKDKAASLPTDAPKLDKDAVTTPNPKDAAKKAEDAAGKAKEQAAEIGKKITDTFKL
ncbi:putative antennal carrier protein AP-2 [Anopheles sinensis]|uniref:Putative antennal carrier protein AP-2 n=1 Tax=Anopheles sinensis TaxID=74873 RepID=A0A084WCM7_ANOSI|nr:putative antennal carrier protein AP-2 [Anopheles sinensis]